MGLSVMRGCAVTKDAMDLGPIQTLLGTEISGVEKGGLIVIRAGLGTHGI